MALNMRPAGLVLEKKRILAWYDSTAFYIILALFSLGAAIFSLTGIKVALVAPGYHKYIWVPEMLLVMSLILMVSSSVRLIRRMVARLREGRLS